ncbi:MAG TPA: hypothetical protein VFX02_09055 [Gammaproteobacteria bacterium]|nr:hypothetical protein [Gammaproteobacteria bacterium]
MNRKQAAGAVIALLLLLNLRQWLFTEDAPVRDAGAPVPADFAEADFRLVSRAGLQPPPGIATVKRDLFFATAAPVSGRQAPARPARAAAAPARDASREAARSALDSFTLVGIVYNQGRYQAFIIKDDKTYTGDEGKLLDGRYLVETVDENTVTLLDTETGLRKRVELTGDESS